MTTKGCGKFRWMTGALIILALGTHLALAAAAEKIPRMTKEELKEMLGKPDVIVLDLRADSDWKNSDQKILGAVREDPAKDAKSWAEKYPKDKTFVLYCA
jgi:hypothetical protein